MIYEPNIDVKRGRGPYCGPTAIALLTGEPISRIEKMIRRKRGGGYRDSTGRKMPIKVTYSWEVIKVLAQLGCRVDLPKKGVKGETLNAVVNECLPATGAYLIEVTGHFMVASGGMIADTTHKTPIPISEYRRKSRRVQRVWKVMAKSKAIPAEG